MSRGAYGWAGWYDPLIGAQPFRYDNIIIFSQGGSEIYLKPGDRLIVVAPTRPDHPRCVVR